MRIALVSEHASPLAVLGGVDAGGQNVFVASLASELGRLGHEVAVYTRRDSASLPDVVPFARGVKVRHVDAGPPEQIPKDELLPYMDEFERQLELQWRRLPPHVAHSHFWMSGKASLGAASRLGIPLAHTFHALGVVKRRCQGERDTSPPSRLDEERRIVEDANCILATCSDEAFELVRLGADLHRLRIIPCGVDVSCFTPAGPVEARRPSLGRIVVVTRLVERKGVGNVISALAEVPDAELVIAGGPERARLAEDPEGARLQALAREEGVTDRVDFRGRVARDALPPLLRSADVVVCIPWYEPFGIVPLEAMACGIPVVASSVGGLIDTVVHGVTGLHVPPRRPSEAASAIRRLLADAELRSALGTAGVARVRARYSWPRIAAAIARVYAQVAAGRAVRRVTRAAR